MFDNFCGMEKKNTDDFLRIMLGHEYSKSSSERNDDQRQLLAHSYMTAIMEQLVQHYRKLLATSPDVKEALDKLEDVLEPKAEEEEEEEEEEKEMVWGHGRNAKRRKAAQERENDVCEI
ncbi:hypothetical protein LX36DRAFT_714461 [Colletotrichum falcatum]|nr:hypothetical protein LX36DRAFT_714461 [Colletotrichum falcatum]